MRTQLDIEDSLPFYVFLGPLPLYLACSHGSTWVVRINMMVHGSLKCENGNFQGFLMAGSDVLHGHFWTIPLVNVRVLGQPKFNVDGRDATKHECQEE